MIKQGKQKQLSKSISSFVILYRRSVELIKNLAQNHLSSARARPQGATGVYFKVNEDGDRGRKPRSTQMNCAISGTLLLLIFSMATCKDPPLVIQGTIVSYNTAEKQCTVKDEKSPYNQVQFNIDKTEIGASPSLGDVVRIAYRNASGENHALRLMNITRQKELKSK